MRAVIWVREDALSRNHPVFAAAGPEARAVFIWDTEDFKRRGHSFKKLVFIYECLLDMNVEVIEGRVATCLKELAHDNTPIFYAKSFNPETLDLVSTIQDDINCRMIKQKPLSEVEITEDMTRFFRYWNKVKREILSPKPES